MLEVLGTMVSSVLSGGATGVLGVAVQRWADYKNKQLDLQSQKDRQAHEVELRKVDLQVMSQEWAGRMQVAQTEADAKVDVADANAMAASYNLEPKQFSAGAKLSRGQTWFFVLLDVFRGVIRPGLSVYLCVLATLIYSAAQQHGASLTADQDYELLKQIVGTILYLWTTCTLWWFGTRFRGGRHK